MPLTIQTNIAALQSGQYVSATQQATANTILQLSTGYRINSPSDDPAGLGISDSLQANIAEYTQAAQNITDGNSVIQTAAGAMTEVTSILTSMSALAEEAANSDVNLSPSAEANVQAEFSSLSSQLTRINNDTTYNGINLFSPAPGGNPSGSFTTLTFQVGIGSNSANDTVSFTNFAVDASTLGVTLGTQSTPGQVYLDTNTNAELAVAAITSAINSVAVDTASIGAVGDALSTAGAVTASDLTSTSAANAGLLDVNVATASTNLAQQQVLEQSGIAVLAQANQQQQFALKLLS